jgi:hypothetical protein
MKLTLWVSSLLFLISACQLHAQKNLSLAANDRETDYRAISDKQAEYLHNLYNQKVKDVDELIDGKDYIPYFFRSKSKPLLFNGMRCKASLIFNGRKYEGISLEYDTYKDELIYYDSTKFIDDKVFKIAMNKNPVGSFSLNYGSDSLNFRYFDREKDKNFNLSNGFYEVVYDGKSRFLIKHQSFPIEKEGLTEYTQTSYDFFSVGDGFIKIRSSKGFVKLFGEKSDEVKKYMRSNRIHFRKANKYKIASILIYYDNLVSPKR